MMTLPPCNCTICYQMYNNERSPLILTKCGHTFCKECLETIMNQTLKHISCPECKQITHISENPGKSLPKNRGLLNLIIYQESLNKKEDILQNKKQLIEGEKVFFEYENAINKIEDTYNKIIEEHSYLEDISDVLLKKEIDDSLDSFISIINTYREELYKKIKVEFERINLIKSFKGSIEKYRMKLNDLYMKLNMNNKTLNISGIEEGRSQLIASILTAPEEEILISESAQTNFSNKDLSNLKSEIEFIELYNLTLKNYSKDIYNPCKFFYVNKFQTEKLIEDLKKLLTKVCDYDECIHTYQINKLNNNEEKRILKEIQEACIHSNFKKLQCIFNHFKINPNFFYSDNLEYISPSTSVLDFNNHINSIGHNTFTSNFNSQLHLSMPGNQRNPANNNVLRNVINNSTNRSNLLTNSTNTNLNNGSNKDKLISLYSLLKQSKDKGELLKFTKVLIEEFNYIPLKLDLESRVEVSFIREIDWKIPLTII